jgi:uncharacterized metal-binding protein YceD (DUF177 family)
MSPNTRPEPCWHVPVRPDDVPDTGLHIDIVADSRVRGAVAALAGVEEIPRLEAAVDVARHGDGLRAAGKVSATVGQTCVVTLEPITSDVEESFEVVFAPAGSSAAAFSAIGPAESADEPAELIVDGVADLGGVLTEFLLLGIDCYPRKPGAAFLAPADIDAAPGPFAVLAKLKNPPR